MVVEGRRLTARVKHVSRHAVLILYDAVPDWVRPQNIASMLVLVQHRRHRTVLQCDVRRLGMPAAPQV